MTEFSRLAPLEGNTLLVIGGCGGIGQALVVAAKAQGLNVLIMDMPVAMERRGLAQSDHVIPIDLRDEVSIKAAFARVSTDLDHIAMCAGYTSGADIIDKLDTDRLDDILSGNLRGPMLAMREAASHLANKASIVLLSTAIGQLGAPGYSSYGAAKAGLNALTRIMAAEWAPNARVNGVAPGAVDTAFIRGGYGAGAREDGKPERFDEAAYIRKIPLARMAVAEDIVGPILFLLSDAAGYITGQVLHVNGGGFMRD